MKQVGEGRAANPSDRVVRREEVCGRRFFGGGRLPEQRKIVEEHPKLGHEVLQDGSGLLHLGAEIALSHQERWDGSGYPNKLHGDNIPQSARIVAVADVLDALLSPRPWRTAWSLDAALAHVRAGAGTLFDPHVVRALDACESEIVALHRRFEAN